MPFRTASFNQKKWILSCLYPLVVLLGWQSFSIGEQEFKLPLALQLDELRLLEPSRLVFTIGAGDADKPGVDASSIEHEIAGYSDCRRRRLEVIANLQSAAPTQPMNCSSFLVRALEQAPSDGRLWLEYSRELVRENGFEPKAIAALRRSFLLAPREGWIINARTAFVLPIWVGLPSDVREIARGEIEEMLLKYSFVAMLAGIYVQNPLARKAISQVFQGATSETQHQFLSKVDQIMNLPAQ